jgi:hypothetical protein
VQPRGRLVEPVEPARRLQPERDRQRLLHERAPRHDGLAVLAGQARRRVRRRLQILQQRLERAAGDEHRRRVEDVLAGRTAMGFGAALA